MSNYSSIFKAFKKQNCSQDFGRGRGCHKSFWAKHPSNFESFLLRRVNFSNSQPLTTPPPFWQVCRKKKAERIKWFDLTPVASVPTVDNSPNKFMGDVENLKNPLFKPRFVHMTGRRVSIIQPSFNWRGYKMNLIRNTHEKNSASWL